MPSKEWQEKMEFVEDTVRRMYDGGIENSSKNEGWDGPVFIDTVVDTVTYISEREDGPDFSMSQIREIVHELVFQEKLRKVSHDMWIDDKVMLDE